MNVGVAYSIPDKQVWMKLIVPDESTVQNVIELSGILDRFPEIDLDNQKVGIFGKFTKLNAIVSEGDRVEIYRPITADPLTIERRDTVDEED